MIARTGIPANSYRAFSLLELVIVVAILGILAAIVVPRLSHSIEGAAESALKANLRIVRTAIEMFAVEHGGILPGSVTDGTNAAGTAQSFRWQLWYCSNSDGITSETNQIDYPFGPYLNKFPKGLLGPGQGRIAVVMVDDGVALTGEANPINPWKYDYTTGEFIFNWNALSSNGVTKYDDF